MSRFWRASASLLAIPRRITVPCCCNMIYSKAAALAASSPAVLSFPREMRPAPAILVLLVISSLLSLSLSLFLLFFSPAESKLSASTGLPHQFSSDTDPQLCPKASHAFDLPALSSPQHQDLVSYPPGLRDIQVARSLRVPRSASTLACGLSSTKHSCAARTWTQGLQLRKPSSTVRRLQITS